MRDDEARGLRYAKQALQHPVHALIRIASHVLYRPWLRYVLGVRAGPGLRVLGLPLVDLRSGAALEIGENVTLNSSNYGYHVNMHSPVKLFAEGPRARIRIGSNTRIHGACLHAYEAIEIGSSCLIAANTQIFDGSGHDLSFPNVADRIHTKGESAPVRIGDNVWIGANCLVLPGVSVGHGSVVAAGSVVVSDVPALAVVAGNPARVVKELGSE